MSDVIHLIFDTFLESKNRETDLGKGYVSHRDLI